MRQSIFIHVFICIYTQCSAHRTRHRFEKERNKVEVKGRQTDTMNAATDSDEHGSSEFKGELGAQLDSVAHTHREWLQRIKLLVAIVGSAHHLPSEVNKRIMSYISLYPWVHLEFEWPRAEPTFPASTDQDPWPANDATAEITGHSYCYAIVHWRWCLLWNGNWSASIGGTSCAVGSSPNLDDLNQRNVNSVKMSLYFSTEQRMLELWNSLNLKNVRVRRTVHTEKCS
mgnify:CR=1 FL=1